VRYFEHNVADPDRTFITGFSMGGHVIGAAQPGTLAGRDRML
jgi:dienelactone hydrolase